MAYDFADNSGDQMLETDEDRLADGAIALALKLTDAQARMKALKGPLSEIVLYLDDSPLQTIVPDGLITEAKAALAEDV